MGINGGEWLVLLVLAFLLIGPERLPDLAQQLGRLTRELKKLATGAKEKVREELGPDMEDLAVFDPRQYDPRRIVREALMDDEPPRPARPPAARRRPPPGSSAAAASLAAGAAVVPPVGARPGSASGEPGGAREDAGTPAETGGASAGEGPGDGGSAPHRGGAPAERRLSGEEVTSGDGAPSGNGVHAAGATSGDQDPVPVDPGASEAEAYVVPFDDEAT